MNKTKSFWRSIPRQSFVVFLLGAFFTFSTIGFAYDIMGVGRQPLLGLVLSVVICGAFATLYATAGILRKWGLLVLIFVIQFAVMNLLALWLPAQIRPIAMNATDIARLENRLTLSGVGTIAAMGLGYACFVIVGVTESRRYFRVHAEMELAAEIHRVLVSPIDSTIDDFAFYGRSLPSGEVGGDLIDLFQHQQHWIAYIADVSGHGVAPGVVMAMVKSAARMQLSSQEKSAMLMERLNAVLYPIKKPEMFATFAYLAWNGERLEYSLAGHPPILHFHAATGEISEVECPNLPLGMFAPQEFASESLTCAPGDLFLILTDGVLEVENSKEEEFGLSGVKRALLQHATPGAQLSSIFQAVLDAVAHHGRAIDDQSMLLIRRAAELPS